MKTYDFKQVSVIAGGRILNGFAEGDDAIMVASASDLWTTQVGADGEVTRSKSNNNTGTVTLKFQQTSESNDILNAFFQSDKLNNGGKFVLLIKDNSGNSLHVSEECWIQKVPDVSYGANAGTREWILSCAALVSTIGGN